MFIAGVICCLLGAPILQNGGFEDAVVSHAWKTYVYKDGKDPVIRVDNEECKEGKQSLLVEAADPSDVAIGQEVALTAGSLWRVRCWIKTEDLVARDLTKVGGLLEVQSGMGSLARTPPRFGTTDWRQEEASFRVPVSGAVRIALFFIGFGKGTGRVWFDDIQLEEIPMTEPQHVAITSERIGARSVDLKQCGQFIEILCDLIPSMIAQQVRSTSFEEEPPFKVSYKAETDKPYRPWYPDGAVHLAKYSFDTQDPFNGKRSQKIELPVPKCRAGVSQDGFCANEGLTYRLRLHMRSQNDVPVWASLHGGGGMIAGPVALGRAGDTWQPAQAQLHAARSVENATLSLEFEGPGTLWLDRVYLIGDNAMLGIWRPDVVEALKTMNCGMIRFGGSTINARSTTSGSAPMLG